MPENSAPCTCTRTRLGPCHGGDTTRDNPASIAAIVARQSAPTRYPTEASRTAEQNRGAADRHRERRHRRD